MATSPQVDMLEPSQEPASPAGCLRLWGGNAIVTDSTWKNGVVDWTEDETAFVSVPFTWELPKAYQRCIMLAAEGYHVRAGGPAVSLMPDYLADVAEIGGEVDALPHHNPNATFTSRGCIRKCQFCAVPRIEGKLRELDDWAVRPIVCDNNIIACSRAHFDDVIDKLKPLRNVDFNQGLDTRLLTEYHAERLAELHLPIVRIAWDTISYERFVMRAIDRLTNAGISPRRVRAYVLIACEDTPEDALYRLETLRQRGINSFLMRYQPLDTLKRDAYIGPHWDATTLISFKRYWGRPHISPKWIHFNDFDENWKPKGNEAQPALTGMG